MYFLKPPMLTCSQLPFLSYEKNTRPNQVREYIKRVQEPDMVHKTRFERIMYRCESFNGVAYY